MIPRVHTVIISMVFFKHENPLIDNPPGIG